LLAREDRFAKTILGYYQFTEADVRRKLEDIQARAEQDPERNWLQSESRRFEVLLDEVEIQIQQWSNQSMDAADQQSEDEIHNGIEAGNRIMSLGGSFHRLSSDAVESFVERQLSVPLSRKYDGVGEQAKRDLQTEMAAAVAQGMSPREITTRGVEILGATRNDVDVITRTNIISAHRDAGIEVYRANSRLVQKYRRLCAKNDDTCPMCLALDGEEEDTDDDFETHPQCRCTTIPIIEGIDQEFDPSGEEWLDAQSAETQNNILGPIKYNLWVADRIKLSDLVHSYNDPDYGPTKSNKSIKQLIQEGTVSKEAVAAAYQVHRGMTRLTNSR
jgi:SPP1 gp7 family putative phage head morphogenesis protein